jgi:hypothetical protein
MREEGSGETEGVSPGSILRPVETKTAPDESGARLEGSRLLSFSLFLYLSQPSRLLPSACSDPQPWL